jgi:hypothetical protein
MGPGSMSWRRSNALGALVGLAALAAALSSCGGESAQPLGGGGGSSSTTGPAGGGGGPACPPGEQLGTTSIECSTIDLDAESFPGFVASFQDLGGNECSCPGNVRPCAVLSTGLEPPAPVE